MDAVPDPKFEFIMQVQLWMRGEGRDVGEIPTGGRRFAATIDGGTFSGPLLKGKVLPGGGEWPHFRPDGTLAINARYCLEEDDGTIIYMQNRGFRREVVPGAFERFRSGPGTTRPEEFYMRVTPTFEVAIGKHDWLTRHIVVGILGEGDPNERGPLINYFRLL